MRIKVRFSEQGQAYTYEAESGSVQVGDVIEVPLSMGGAFWRWKHATVISLTSDYKGKVAKVRKRMSESEKELVEALLEINCLLENTIRNLDEITKSLSCPDVEMRLRENAEEALKKTRELLNEHGNTA